MDRKLAFSTFMKLLELDDKAKETALRGFLRGGGFNYWRPLQLLSEDVVSGKLDAASLQTEVARLCKGHQKKYNTNALTKLLFWSSRRKVKIQKRPNQIVCEFSKHKKSSLNVKIEPELAFSKSGTKYLMHIWATNSPSLSEETLSMALYFFREKYRKETGDDWQYLIFDTVKNRVFSEIDILDDAPAMLLEQSKLLGEMWHSTNYKITGDGESNEKPYDQHPVAFH